MQENLPNKIRDYIDKRAYTKWKLEWNEIDGIDLVVVVPAICEFENIKTLLLSLIKNSDESFPYSLILFVINNSKSASQEIKNDNELSINFLRSVIQNQATDKLPNLISKSEIQIGLIDASTEGFEFEESKAGVGLARKIGMDTALRIFNYSNNSNKIIACLDADCIIEENYLSQIRNSFIQNKLSAALVDFEHQIPEKKKYKLGILSYEIFLRHYVVGLLFAKSPFAFHTVGSTIVCDHQAYVKVGGMNTKKAAEDFYFLEKLAKNFLIGRITSTKVYPSARESWRVPFGTGRTMSDYLSNKKKAFIFDPEVYLVLKHWNEIFCSELLLNPDSILSEAKKIHPELYNYLDKSGFKSDWERILNNTNSQRQLEYQRKNWFDAFKTLKLIHHLRDTSFSMLDLITGVEKLFEVVHHNIDFSYAKNVTTDQLTNYLNELKKIENNLSIS